MNHKLQNKRKDTSEIKTCFKGHKNMKNLIMVTVHTLMHTYTLVRSVVCVNIQGGWSRGSHICTTVGRPIQTVCEPTGRPSRHFPQLTSSLFLHHMEETELLVFSPSQHQGPARLAYAASHRCIFKPIKVKVATSWLEPFALFRWRLNFKIKWTRNCSANAPDKKRLSPTELRASSDDWVQPSLNEG